MPILHPKRYDWTLIIARVRPWQASVRRVGREKIVRHRLETGLMVGYDAAMDNVISVELLDRGPDGIAEWNRLRSAGAPAPILRDRRMRGAQLQGADLHAVDLRGCDLLNADLRNADLTEAILARANVRNADLSGAKLQRANIARGYLTDTSLMAADLSRAWLRGADLSNTKLQQADLKDAVLAGADLRRADLTDADLRGAYFGSDAGLTEAVRSAFAANAAFRTVDVDRNDAPCADFRGAQLSGAAVGSTEWLDALCSLSAPPKGLSPMRWMVVTESTSSGPRHIIRDRPAAG